MNYWAVLRGLLPYLLSILAATAVAYGIYSFGRHAERAEWQVLWSERDSQDAQEQAHAEKQARIEEQRRADWAAGVQRDATQQIEKLRGDVDGASADAQRLRDELGKLQKRFGPAGQGTGAPISSTSATRAAMVLSELLDRCVGQRQELAGAFDRARIAGLACEASYDGLGQPNQHKNAEH
jgi:hypothetical protein